MSASKTPPPREVQPPGGAPAPQIAGRERAPLRTCPNCGAALTDRSCKLACPSPGCGYYLSCSDYL